MLPYIAVCTALLINLVAAIPPATLEIALEPWCNDSVRVRIHPGPVEGLKPARLYFSSKRQDTVLCISDACLHSELTSGYSPLALSAPEEGYAPQYNLKNVSTVTLLMYYSHVHLANFVAPSGIPPPDKTFAKVAFNAGKILASIPPSHPPEHFVPLDIYVAPDKLHTITFASQAARTWAISHHYTLLHKDVGYLCTTSTCSGDIPVPSPTGILRGLPGAITEGYVIGR